MRDRQLLRRWRRRLQLFWIPFLSSLGRWPFGRGCGGWHCFGDGTRSGVSLWPVWWCRLLVVWSPRSGCVLMVWSPRVGWHCTWWFFPGDGRANRQLCRSRCRGRRLGAFCSVPFYVVVVVVSFWLSQPVLCCTRLLVVALPSGIRLVVSGRRGLTGRRCCSVGLCLFWCCGPWCCCVRVLGERVQLGFWLPEFGGWFVRFGSWQLQRR